MISSSSLPKTFLLVLALLQPVKVLLGFCDVYTYPSFVTNIPILSGSVSLCGDEVLVNVVSVLSAIAVSMALSVFSGLFFINHIIAPFIVSPPCWSSPCTVTVRILLASLPV